MRSEWLTYTFDAIALVAFAIPSVWTSFKFALKPSRDVIGLQETKLATTAAMLLAFNIILLNLGVAAHIVVQSLRQQQLELLLFGIPPILVLFVALFAYVAMNFRFGAMVKSPSIALSLESRSRLRSNVVILTEQLGLKSVPALKISAEGISPFCYGKSAKHSTVVVPENFEPICLQASQSESQKANLLERFVLGHELSHIKHGDCAVMSWLTLFYTDIRVALVAGALCSAICILLRLPSDLQSLVVTPFLLTLVCTPFLKWAIARIARYRELMADARSSQLFSHNEVEQMVETNAAERLSPLEFLITYFSIRPEIGNYARKSRWPSGSWLTCATLGWAEESQPRGSSHLHLREKLREALACFHPSIEDRHAALRSQNYAGESPPFPSWSAAIQIQLIESLSFLILVACSSLVIFPLATLFVQLPEARGLTLGILGGATMLVLVVFPTLVFSLPARVSSQTLHTYKDSVLPLLKRYLAGAGLGLLVLMPMLPFLIKSFSSGYITKSFFSYLWFVTLYSVGQFLGLLFSILLSGLAPTWGGEYTKPQKIYGIILLLPCFLAAVAMTVPIIPVFGKMEFLLGGFSGCAVASYLAVMIESGYLHQLLVMRIGRVTVCLEGLYYRRWAQLLLFGIIGVPFVVGSWLTAVFWHRFVPLFMKVGRQYLVPWYGGSSGIVLIFATRNSYLFYPNAENCHQKRGKRSC